MNFFNIFMIAIGLSMDAFAVTLAKSMTMKSKDLLKYAFILALFFGGFQAFMPFIGWFLGTYFHQFINSFAHFVAFGLLLFIGINMIKETLSEEEENDDKLDIKTIILLAIATSNDAFAVGVSFALLNVNIFYAISIIGIVTFAICFVGVFIGHKLGDFLDKYAGIAGGVILIAIAIKILIEHYL